MAFKKSKLPLGILAASQLVPWVAYSQVYMTEEQVIQEFFPGESFTRKTIELTPVEKKAIEDHSGENVRNTQLVVWVSKKGNAVFIDQALGKHEFITYAVALTAAKTVRGIDILEYRETYGYQVRNEDWRKQFVGKDTQAPLKLNKDIVNISGATLSSSHITGGVRRVLQTFATVQARL